MEFVRMLHCGCKKTTKRISMHCFFKRLIFGGGGVFITGCGEWGLLPGCRVQASPCRDSSYCQAEALGHGLSSCGLQVPEHRLRQLCLTGLAALRQVDPSQTRDRTRVPCAGRWLVNHCTTREVQKTTFLKPLIFGLTFL